ncbi:hypothetical protein HR060_05620 [Catenovulum sp. SM1970]|uniref:hypothetical protein n=1 Tax=Marinifaba aquimaris TaxID=2741323 RepID=UPI0015725E47|nr:hypothetical protein [Marinifaba aquimaris]NTS76342.1 hypothetical protein [Marinifaba aquimaris]
MKNVVLKSSILVGAILSAFNVAASQSVKYDTDGTNRWTSYQGGALSSVVTSSDSATNINFVAHTTFYASEADCTTSPALYNSDTGAFIASGSISYANAQSTVLWGGFEAPAQYAFNNKVAKFTCYLPDGSVQVLEHKIPGAPQVTWNMDLAGVGEFNNGRYAQLKSTGYASINNKTNEGRCAINARNIAPTNLFNGKDSKVGFYSDYFGLTETISTHSGDEVVIGFTCSNSGGSTSYIKRWDISGETVRLIESTVTTN